MKKKLGAVDHQFRWLARVCFVKPFKFSHHLLINGDQIVFKARDGSIASRFKSRFTRAYIANCLNDLLVTAAVFPLLGGSHEKRQTRGFIISHYTSPFGVIFSRALSPIQGSFCTFCLFDYRHFSQQKHVIVFLKVDLKISLLNPALKTHARGFY